MTKVDEARARREAKKDANLRAEARASANKRTRTRLARSELWMAIAVQTQAWANRVRSDADGYLPFDQWPTDDPFRKLCTIYDLTPEELAKLIEKIGGACETRSVNSGYGDDWEAMSTFSEDFS
jgi:hypothetical protein